MKGQTDWFAVWPVATAGGAFALVYGLTLIMGESVETVLFRSVAALVVVGVVSIALQIVLSAGRAEPEPESPSRALIDITLPEEDPDVIDAAGVKLLPGESSESVEQRATPPR